MVVVSHRVEISFVILPSKPFDVLYKPLRHIWTFSICLPFLSHVFRVRGVQLGTKHGTPPGGATSKKLDRPEKMLSITGGAAWRCHVLSSAVCGFSVYRECATSSCPTSNFIFPLCPMARNSVSHSKTLFRTISSKFFLHLTWVGWSCLVWLVLTCEQPFGLIIKMDYPAKHWWCRERSSP